MDLILIVVTLLSLTVAAMMSLVAWRAVRSERRRSEARVTALAADIHILDDVQGRDTAPAGAATRAPEGDLPLQEVPTSISTRSMFAPDHPTPTRSRLAVVVALGVLGVGASAALAVVLGGAGRSTGVEPRSDAAQQAPSAENGTPENATMTNAPLELVALGHERDADSLTVRGVLRNPASGKELGQLTAVVLLFNHDGGFVASGRAAVQAPTLEPGGETTFVITIPGVADVERYRVSFRIEDRVVPHVDVRG
jgi:hypothetical protein